MLQIFIIVFREILEITVILGLVLVATHGLRNRNIWVLAGVIFGMLGSLIIALSTSAISNAFEGMGQEYFNAALLLVITIMLVWTIVWMKVHGYKLSQDIKNIGAQAQNGEVSLVALTTMVAATIFREGSEIVLFTYGAYTASNLDFFSVLGGGLAGLAVGLIVGGAMYFGLIRFSGKHVFQITAILLSLVAAGMAAHAVNFLSATGLMPVYSTPLWDSTGLIQENSVLGQILGILIGYSARPSLLQLIAYFGTLLVIRLIVTRNDGKYDKQYWRA